MMTVRDTSLEALYDFAGLTIRDYIRRHCSAAGAPLLDVGAGWGKYARLLPEYTMDAVEVYQPYIEQDNLAALYRTVHQLDVRRFTWPLYYGAVIFGDVLEHLDVDGAQRVIGRACDSAYHVLVAVPFLHPQDAVGGVGWEVHIQDDLTERVMAYRYPELQLLAIQRAETTKAIYVKEPVWMWVGSGSASSATRAR